MQVEVEDTVAVDITFTVLPLFGRYLSTTKPIIHTKGFAILPMFSPPKDTLSYPSLPTVSMHKRTDPQIEVPHPDRV